MRLSFAQWSPSLYVILILFGCGSRCESAEFERHAPVLTSSTLNTSNSSTVVQVLTETVEPLPKAPELQNQPNEQVANVNAKPGNKPPITSPVVKSPVVYAPTTPSAAKSTNYNVDAYNIDSKDKPPTASNPQPPIVSDTQDKNDQGGGLDAYKPSPTTTVPTTTYTNEQVTITSAPNWGNQKIPVNTCYITAPGGDFEWIPCMVFAGTVQLSFFPEPSGNLTYPSTYFDPALGITLTSPLVYMVINTLTASNSCGRLGPTYSNYIISMDLTDVSTMRAYPDATARDRLGDPRPLTLADLATNCPKFSDAPQGQTLLSSMGAVIDEHPVDNDWNRCNPRLVMPDQMKSVGLPYWNHCGNDNGHFGIFDPPGAVPPVQGIFPTKAPAPVVPAPSPPAQPAPTIPPSPPPTALPDIPEPKQKSPSPVPQPKEPSPDPNPIVVPQPSPSNPDLVAPMNPAPVPTTPNQPGTLPQTPEGQPAYNPSPIAAAEPSAIAVIGSNTIHAGSSGIILPGAIPASVGHIATLIDTNNNAVIVSVASSGMYIGTGASASYIPNPTIPPAAHIVNGAPIPIATLNGEVVDATPGATTLVIKGQTLTAGGPPVTISGTEDVAVLGNSGLIVQYPGGQVSYFPLPTVAPTQAKLLPDGSAIVYEGKTLSLGGPPATLADNAVVSLGSSGVVVQRPNGIESIVPLSQFTSTGVSPDGEGEDDMGGIIVGMLGIDQPPGKTTPPIVAASATSPLLISSPSDALSIQATITTNANGSTASNITYLVSTTSPSGTVGANTTDAPENLQASSGTRTAIWGGACMVFALMMIFEM